jgi:hypothetical protein
MTDEKTPVSSTTNDAGRRGDDGAILVNKKDFPWDKPSQEVADEMAKK